MAFLPQGSVGQVTDAYRNNPGALQERYGVTKQLIDLMALQRINAEQQAIANQMEMDLGAQANKDGKIADEVAMEAFDNTTKNIAQMSGLAGIINERNAQGGSPQAGGPQVGGPQVGGPPQGIDQIPAQNMERMSDGGIVAFARGSDDAVDASRLNNNPLNLRNYDQGWEGEIPSTDEFSQFSDLKYGVRAADQTLENYKDLHGIDTVREIVERYAPPSENDTETYIEFVSEQLGVSPDQPIDLDNSDVRDSVLTAMGRMESNFEYDRTMLDGTDRERTSEEIVASDVGDDGSTDIVEELTALQQARGEAGTTQGAVQDAIGRSMDLDYILGSPKFREAVDEQRRPLLEERDAAFGEWWGAEQEAGAARREESERAEFEAAGIPYPEEEIVEEVISTEPAPDNTLAAVDPEAARNQYEDAMYQRDPRMRAFYEALGGEEGSAALAEKKAAEARGTGAATTAPSTGGLNWEELTEFLSNAQGTTTGSALGAGAQAMTTGRHARETLDRDEALQYAKIASDIQQIELRNKNELDQIRATAKADMDRDDRLEVDAAWREHVKTTKYMADMTAIGEMDAAQQDVALSNYIMTWYDRQRSMRELGLADYSSILGTGTTTVANTGT